MKLYPLALLVLFAGLALRPWLSRNICRCRPNDACWPSRSDWNRFNSTVGGHLLHVKPVGWPCSANGYDQLQCKEVVTNFHNSTWRVEHPGASQILNWEYWPSNRESCYVEDGKASTCEQGRVPYYTVRAHSVDEVRWTVEFAQARNLRLVVRNTGHDLSGRSSAPQSIQLDMSGLKDITVRQGFVPQTPHNHSDYIEPEYMAVTVGAGVLTGELYRVGKEHGFVVVGGGCSTVGIAGGYMQSGGLSPLSPLKGLASDHVLEIEAITADGSNIIANQYQNEDLFWALRGGGGGTFAIITSMTLRTFPDFPASVVRLSLGASKADKSFWSSVTVVLSSFPNFNNVGNSAQMMIFPSTFAGNAMFVLEGFLLDSEIDTGLMVMSKLRHTLETLEHKLEYTREDFASMASYLAIPKRIDQAGVNMLSTAILVSCDLITKSESGPTSITAMLSNLDHNPGDAISIESTMRGLNEFNESYSYSSTHPSMRSSLLSLTLARGIPSGPDWTAHRLVRQELEVTQRPALANLENGAMGSYLAYGYPYEKSPGKAFWGANYARLLRIKRSWDKESFFLTRLGVGSEEWDDDGMCESKSVYKRPGLLKDALKQYFETIAV